MANHVIKFQYKDGKKLAQPILWCERKSKWGQWYFQDAHHAALAVGGSIAPCKNCIKAIIKELSKEL